MLCLHIYMYTMSMQVSAEARTSELELQVVMNCLMWILGAQARSWTRAASVFKPMSHLSTFLPFKIVIKTLSNKLNQYE